MNKTAEIHAREASFHDTWASCTPLADVRVRECFESPTAVENRFILERMGTLKGKRLLDVGAGLGESSVYFALQGAEVTMVDISPQMIAKGCEVARRHGVEIEGRAAVGEELPVSNNSFDIVYIANTIHHVTNRERLFGEIKRVLKPGGCFFSIDPIAYNPAINVYRRMANQVRTEDESPLTRADLRLARSFFPNMRWRMFWMTTLALFAKYFLIDRVHPNQDRYWKRILTESKKSLWWWFPLRALDSLLTHLPGVRWWSWNIVLWGRKEI